LGYDARGIHQFTNILNTPSGSGCMANAIGGGASAGAMTGAGAGSLGFAGGPVGGITVPGGIAIGVVGGGASGMMLGMIGCPGGAANGGAMARREFHDEKMGGGGDRTLGELKADAKAIYQQYGKIAPRWMQ
jgi:hypothetical protein